MGRNRQWKSTRGVLAAVTVAVVGASSPQQAAALLGEPVGAVRTHPFFGRFHLGETARRPLLADAHVVVLQPPPYSRARDQVEVLLTVGPGHQVLAYELRLDRRFVSGRDATHAREILQAFLTAAAPPDDLGPLQAFLAEADSLATLAGNRERTQATLPLSLARLENGQRTTGDWLFVSLAWRPALAGVAPGSERGLVLPGLPWLPVTLPAGPAVQAALPQPGEPALPDAAPRRPWLESFLDAADLGDRMSHVRDERLHGPDPADLAYEQLRGEATGDSTWVGTHHDAIWRLVDTRWLFPDETAATNWLGERARWHTEGLPRRSGLPTAGDETLVFGGTRRGWFAGVDSTQYVYLFRVGRTVCKLYAVAGPDAAQPLTPEHVRDLALRAAERVRAALPRTLALPVD